MTYTGRTMLNIRSGSFAALSIVASGTGVAEAVEARRDALALERESELPHAGKPLGIALVGLGNYSTKQLAPALESTQYCKLVAVVTGSPEKAKQWQQRYNIEPQNIYDYQNFETIRDNKAVDIVYVVLPNALHAEYVIKAAQAGKHVICEKPMALSASQCEEMILACRKANRLLSIGYRLHFEPHNMAISQYQKDGAFGVARTVIARDGMDIEPGVWRLNKELAGGGPMMDMGIYCVQAAIYALNELPIAVTAREGEKTDKERFRDVEQSMY